ncbi:TPA: arginine:agmatine antiporter, partial [Escherichia coli]
CLFMFYASEIKYLAMVPVLLTLGVPLFIWARKKDDRADKIFTLRELAFFILLLVLDIIVFILLHYKTIHF